MTKRMIGGIMFGMENKTRDEGDAVKLDFQIGVTWDQASGEYHQSKFEQSSMYFMCRPTVLTMWRHKTYKITMTRYKHFVSWKTSLNTNSIFETIMVCDINNNFVLSGNKPGAITWFISVTEDNYHDHCRVIRQKLGTSLPASVLLRFAAFNVHCVSHVGCV